MDTRLVVYRKETSVSTSDTSYELDLDKVPNIRINYNWLDIKEPETRKSNFSQTIKLPFTNRNNTFFENWFDVNLDTLVYNTKTKFKAVILVDTVPQLEGYIQLKAIYLNARLYEVVVFGDTANFFADIKNKKLRDTFIDADGVVDRQLDHFNTAANVVTSWTSPGLTTVLSTTTNDVMYPIIDYGHTLMPLSEGMFWQPSTINIGGGDDASFSEVLSLFGAVRIGDLKPAIRIQKLLYMIIQKAGYSIKSSFFGLDDTAGTPVTDTQWFSRLFMTLAPQFTKVRTKVHGNFLYTASSQSLISGDVGGYLQDVPNWDTVVYDPSNMWSTGTSNTLTITYNPDTPDVMPTGSIYIALSMDITFATQDSGGNPINNWNIMAQWESQDGLSGMIFNQTFDGTPTTSNYNFIYTGFIPLANSQTFELQINIGSYDIVYPNTATSTLNSASIGSFNLGDSVYTNGSINAEVIMAENMPDITQADFVKDLVNRFNLIVQVDKDNPKMLLVEPYQDFIDSGVTRYWTDKLDTSKEQVVKSTNEIQSKELNFTDLEDKDYFNKSYIDKWGAVWGSRLNFNRNDFAQKDFKNFSIYSPFIANGLMGGNGAESQIAVASIFEINEDDQTRQPIEGGKPKLFYYSGTPISITGQDPLGDNYDFHVFSGIQTTLGNTEAYSTGNTFPLCTQYNLDSLTAITSSTKIVSWDYYNPFFSTGYTTPVFGDTVSLHGFYYDYWANYINEIYSDEARIMDCNLNLNEVDIFNFNFADTIYIKNTLWRVLSINNYVVGGKETTKVRLIKVISKLAYDCDVLPYDFNENGTITFVNPENPSGGAVDVTNACCEDIDSSWTFQQTNNSTGTGDCYHNMNTPTGPQNTGNTDGVVGYGDTESIGFDGNSPIPLLMPIFGSTQNTVLNRGYGSVQSSTFYMYANTYDDTVANFLVNGMNHYDLIIPQNSMVSFEIELIGTVQIDTDTPANVSKVGYYNYTTLLKNIQGTNSAIGTAGGILTKSNADSGFPTPTAGFTTFNNEFWAPTIQVSGEQQIGWVAKVKMFIQPIPRDSSQFRNLAIYQNGDGILFQNVSRLEWN
tara:strand:+ start:3276 stop:6506 length:3231 start_codon:yes stop_codon:yes gene_type:complete